MLEVKIRGFDTMDLPYSVRLYGVTEEMFDEYTDEDVKAELIDGVMILRSPSSLQTASVVGFLHSLMSFYADSQGLGKVLGPLSLVRLNQCRKFAPDVWFTSFERVPSPLPKQFEGAPDLVVEVLSESNRDDDLDDKRPAYQQAGVGEIWFVDMEFHQVIVDRKRDEGYVEDVISEGRVTSNVLEGFWVDAAWLWSEPLPNRMACLQEILSMVDG